MTAVDIRRIAKLRWLRKAKRVFPRDNISAMEQYERAVELARDVWRTLDKTSWRKKE